MQWMMNTLIVTRAELEDIKCLPIKFRPDWPAVFSTNGNKTWLWRRWGNTPLKEREEVTGRSPVVDEIVKQYLLVRPPGGRFFIDDRGAFYTPEFLRIKLGEFPIIAFQIQE